MIETNMLYAFVKKEDLDKWHQAVTAEGLVGKGNLRLLITDEHVFYGSFSRQNLTVVSIPQLIVDLLKEGGVCTEAAEKLISKFKAKAISLCFDTDALSGISKNHGAT